MPSCGRGAFHTGAVEGSSTAGSPTGSIGPIPPPVGPQHRFVADAGTGSRMTADLMRVQFGQPRTLITWALALVALTLFGAAAQQIVVALVVGVLLLTVLVLLVFSRTRRTMRAAFRAGSVHTSTFGPQTMTISGPIGTSEVRYAAFKRLWVGPHSIVLRRRDAAVLHVVPIELVPSEAVSLIERNMPKR